ncbi:RNA-binding protein asd-2, partial [Dissostichus eleginoides]
ARAAGYMFAFPPLSKATFTSGPEEKGSTVYESMEAVVSLSPASNGRFQGRFSKTKHFLRATTRSVLGDIVAVQLFLQSQNGVHKQKGCGTMGSMHSPAPLHSSRGEKLPFEPLSASLAEVFRCDGTENKTSVRLGALVSFQCVGSISPHVPRCCHCWAHPNPDQPPFYIY